MTTLVVTSILDAEYRDDLERLLFFNENQERASKGVMHVVKRYGAPRIQIHDGRVRIELDSKVEPQSLFAVVQSKGRVGPVGVMVYTREEDALVVLFVAIDGLYAIRGAKGSPKVFARMINEIKRIGLRVRGISSVLVYLGRSKPTRIKLHRAPDL